MQQHNILNTFLLHLRCTRKSTGPAGAATGSPCLEPSTRSSLLGTVAGKGNTSGLPLGFDDDACPRKQNKRNGSIVSLNVARPVPKFRTLVFGVRFGRVCS